MIVNPGLLERFIPQMTVKFTLEVKNRTRGNNFTCLVMALKIRIVIGK